MGNETGLGIDAIYKKPVEDIVSEWKFRVDRRQDSGMPFSMFWVAGSDEKTIQAIGYITEQLGIDKSAVIEFEIDPNKLDVTNNLDQFADKVRLVNGNRVLMIARGFEKVLPETTFNRAGHDWDQVVVESPEKTRWGKLYSGISKHIVIITTIGFSAGRERYDKNVRSAVASHFKTGILELK